MADGLLDALTTSRQTPFGARSRPKTRAGAAFSKPAPARSSRLNDLVCRYRRIPSVSCSTLRGQRRPPEQCRVSLAVAERSLPPVTQRDALQYATPSGSLFQPMRTPSFRQPRSKEPSTPWRSTGVAFLCVAVCLATAGAAAPSRDSTAAPTGQVWALALPSSVKSVSPAQVDWLASKGVTAIVASKLSPESLRQLTASARRASLIVIAPRPAVPSSACRSTAGTLRTCASPAGTPAAAVKLARRSLVDYVIVRVRTLQGLGCSVAPAPAGPGSLPSCR